MKINSPSNGDTLGSGDYEVIVYYSIDDMSKAKSWEVVILVYDPVLFAQQKLDINPITILNFGQRQGATNTSGTLTFNDSFAYGDMPPEDMTVTAMLIAWTDFQGTGIPSEVARNDVNIHVVPTAKPGTNSPGAIYVSSSPGNAQIYINGKYQVDTNESIDNPFGFTDLAPGKYTVTLKKDGYVDYTETVDLQPDQIYTLKAVMKAGTTPTGWIQINTDPDGVDVYLQGTKVAVAPIQLTGVPPGTYEIVLKKSGYENWTDTITVAAGQFTTVNAELPLSSGGGFPVGGVVGGAAAVGVVGGGIALLRGRMKGVSVKTAPAGKDLYQQWWNNATPAQRGDWNSFDDFLNSRLGKPLNGYVNEYGNPSWSSAYNSWKKEGSGEPFEDWAKRQSANQKISEQGDDWFERNKYARRQDIADADNAVGEAKLNQQRFQRLTELRNIVSSDAGLSDFVGDASNGIVKNGIVDPNKLNRLENNLKRWIIRDKINQPGSDYTYSDAYFDTVRQSTQGYTGLVVRLGAGIVTGGYSEMAFNPISALSTMHDGIMAGDSTGQAVVKGLKQSAFELGVGEAGRVVKPLINYGKQSYNSYKLGKVSAELKSEISTVSQLAKQTDGQMTRNAFMKTTEVAKAGENAAYKLTSAEKEALRINNNPELRKLMSNNSDLIPNDFKEVLGTAKQKSFELSRNNAANDVIQQMSKDGINTAENPYFIRQTGTHAQPGNPGWNSVKSDFDHTVEFGNTKYNQLYEQKFNAHLEAQGTSSKAIDANVYGEGTSSRGAYTGGAKKFVEHYNETSGSDIMIRNNNGATSITRETPQTSKSMLSRMNADDVNSAHQNYQDFFNKDVAKGTDLNNQIINGSKTVSRDAGQYSTNYVKNYQQTGKVNYNPPPAAKVADLIKKRGFSIDDAMKKVGYTGSKQQLLNDFRKIMGL